MMKRRAYALAVAAAACLLSACDTGIRSSSLVIERIVDPSATTATVHVALSDSPQFTGGYKPYSAAIALGGPAVPILRFDAIAWEPKDGAERARAFWLFVAQDANSTGVIDDFDDLLPAMRVMLVDGEETVVPLITFDPTGSAPSRLFQAVLFDDPPRSYRVFIEDPGVVGGLTPLYLRLGDTADLSIPGNVNYDIPIPSASLASGLSMLTGALNGMLWIDNNQSGALDAGDWISAQPNAAPVLVEFNDAVLWSGQTMP